MIILLKILVVFLIVALLVYGLASFDKIFTFVEPGTAKIVLFNNGYFRTIFNFLGYGITPNEEIRKIEDLQGKYRTPWKILGGLRFIGIPPFFALYYYTLRWSVLWRNVTELEKELTRSGTEGEVAKGSLLQRSESVSEFYLKATPYGLMLPDIEDRDKIPVSIVFIVMASIRNPSKAAFRVNSWWTAVSDNLLAEIRPWVGLLSWEEVKSIRGNFLPKDKPGVSTEEHKQEMIAHLPPRCRKIFDKVSFFERVDELVKRMEADWGVEVVSIRIDDIILPDSIAQAATKGYVGKQEADAIRAVAKAERDRIKTVFGAATAHGDDGVAMKIAEDISRGAKSTWVIGAKPLREAIRDLTKGKES